MKSHLIVVRFISTAITISFKFILIAFLEAFILMTYARDIAGDKTKDTFFIIWMFLTANCARQVDVFLRLSRFDKWILLTFCLMQFLD